jgi:hypothetical protein
MKKNSLLILILAMFGITACYKTPTYPDVPVLEFDHFDYRGDAYTLGDSGNLYLKFTDGDGDLGILGRDSSSQVIYINTSDTFFHQVYFNIPEIPKKGTTDDISGTIQIKFADALFSAYDFYFNSIGKTIDTFAFKMKIKDRAGHESNEITTPPIVVKMP